ncbi:GGDEF domain-containing protein [Psychromonas antarctica]|jgi:diguanylate cyclase (GGDEF)-like protein|uniref:GGDEF domain-containing protein n=1 Tax=Psychromonas antarctica TaxID=67573 RepID=UPI001EE8F59E|nr:GGDEF domain-containing protein [Psychromonas antarctica]MCG6201023.1 GGDEF domain-containing protein [Psychromonas antarctica]
MDRPKRQRKKKLVFDIVLILLLNAFFWIFLRERDLLEQLNLFVRNHPHYHLEQAIPLVFTALLSLLYFVIRRWREGMSLANSAAQRISTDALTKLYNRRALESKLSIEWERFIRYKAPFCLMMLDIDDFKVINTQLGNQEGDRIIINIAEILLNNTRKTDFCARWGGTEFLILCPVSELQAISVLAERLRGDIYRLLKGGVELSVSLGVAQADPKKSLEGLIKSTDLALHKAKKTGGNCVLSSE